MGAVARAAGLPAVGGLLLVTGAMAVYLVATMVWLTRENARLAEERDRRLYQVKCLTADVQEHVEEIAKLRAENGGYAGGMEALRMELAEAKAASFDGWSSAALAKKLAEVKLEIERAQGSGHWAAEAQKLAGERDELRARISMLTAKGKRVVADRDRWQAEATRLAAESNMASSSDEKFKATKRAFAQHFHPNNGGAEGLEKTVRTVIFTQFWPVLEGIERGARAQH